MEITYDKSSKYISKEDKKVFETIATRSKKEKFIVGFYSDHDDISPFCYYYLAEPISVKGFLGREKIRKKVLIALASFNVHRIGCTILDKDLKDIVKEEVTKYANTPMGNGSVREAQFVEDYEQLILK